MKLVNYQEIIDLTKWAKSLVGLGRICFGLNRSSDWAESVLGPHHLEPSRDPFGLRLRLDIKLCFDNIIVPWTYDIYIFRGQ